MSNRESTLRWAWHSENGGGPWWTFVHSELVRWCVLARYRPDLGGYWEARVSDLFGSHALYRCELTDHDQTLAFLNATLRLLGSSVEVQALPEGLT